MANSLQVITMITNESMRVAHEKATFISTINRQYDDSYAKKGGKIGSSLRIRKPNEYTVTTSSRAMDAQDQTETYETVTMASQYHVDMHFTSDELTLSIDELSARYIDPAMSVLVSKIESDVIQGVTRDIYNVTGTAGTALANSGDLAAFVNARARLNQGLAPSENRSLQLDSVQMGAVVNGSKSLFHPENQVKKAFVEGYYGRAMGANWYENERILTHTVGSDVTVATSSSAAVTDGGTNITMNSTDGNIKEGDVFTVAGVFACHPETKASLGYLQQFVATADSTGAVTVSPPTYLTGAKQNVCSAAGAQLATTAFNSQTMTFIGSANASYRTALMYHRDAFTFVTADLPIMDDAHKCQRLTQDGISLRVWQASDIVNDRLLMRIDCLFGYATIRAPWAVRLVGSAVS